MYTVIVSVFAFFAFCANGKPSGILVVEDDGQWRGEGLLESQDWENKKVIVTTGTNPDLIALSPKMVYSRPNTVLAYNLLTPTPAALDTTPVVSDVVERKVNSGYISMVVHPEVITETSTDEIVAPEVITDISTDEVVAPEVTNDAHVDVDTESDVVIAADLPSEEIQSNTSTMMMDKNISPELTSSPLLVQAIPLNMNIDRGEIINSATYPSGLIVPTAFPRLITTRLGTFPSTSGIQHAILSDDLVLSGLQDGSILTRRRKVKPRPSWITSGYGIIRKTNNVVLLPHKTEAVVAGPSEVQFVGGSHLSI